ncbi:MAG: adenylate/guanylate cyclase domain-containing protein [Pseudomonadota bacterium]
MSHEPLTAEIEDWLLQSALEDPEIAPLFETLCVRLRALGLPLDRVMLSWVILHPLFGTEELVWRPDEPLELEQRPHAALGNAVWWASPLAHVHVKRLDTFRRRLTGPDALLDFLVLEHFRDSGFTDYLITAASFSIGALSDFLGGTTGMMASWSTKRETGFSVADLTALERIRKPLAVAVHAALQRRVLDNVATTFLGATAGARLLKGEIKLGDGETIPAVLWFSDLRGSTRLSDAMDPSDYLALLNIYYACTAAPVIEAGGEILTFIGDGVLAGFRVGEGDVKAAVARAETAMVEARTRREAALAEGTPADAPLEFGIGLALGEVMMGNIGVPSRLAFSGIGTAVNRAQRIEASTKRLGRPVLAERAVVELSERQWTASETLTLDGLAAPVELFAPADNHA